MECSMDLELTADPPISEFMNRQALSGDSNTPLRDVVQRMLDTGSSAFVVCEDAFPIGVVTERNIVEILHDVMSGVAYEQLTVRSVMASPLQTLPETATMVEVIEMMGSRFFRQVPITDSESRLCGIVNMEELQAAMNELLSRRGKDLERAVQRRTAELEEANLRLEELSLRDGLTGLFNRRAMRERFSELHGLAARNGNPYSVILCDIDYFKALNDSLGHLEGDRVLRRVAENLSSAMRVSDSIYRYGGEEFLAILPETRAPGARQVAERMRRAIESLEIGHGSSAASPFVTLSFGVAETRVSHPDSQETWEQTIDRADKLLYRAKSTGRNRVVADCG